MPRYLVSHLVHPWHNLLVPTPGRVELAHRGTGARRSLPEPLWRALTAILGRPRTEEECAAALAEVGLAAADELRDLIAGRFLVEPQHDFWQDYLPDLAGDAAGAGDADLARGRLRWTRDLLEHGLWMYPKWLGFPVLQWPTDLIFLQMLLHEVRPGFLVETGRFRGGGALFCASIFELLGEGRVVSVERRSDPQAAAALAGHPLGRRITMIDGDSTDPRVVARVAATVGGAGPHVMVFDAEHSTEHVRAELEAYAPLCAGAGKLVVCDTSMSLIPEHRASNPQTAVRAFLAEHADQWRLSPWAGAGFVTCAEDGILERLP